jgi:hypothetical protein
MKRARDSLGGKRAIPGIKPSGSTTNLIPFGCETFWNGTLNLCMECNTYNLAKHYPLLLIYPFCRCAGHKRIDVPFCELELHLCCFKFGINTDIASLLCQTIICHHFYSWFVQNKNECIGRDKFNPCTDSHYDPCKSGPSMKMAILDIIITGDFERISNGTLDQILEISDPTENGCKSEWKRIIKKYKFKLTKMKMPTSN